MMKGIFIGTAENADTFTVSKTFYADRAGRATLRATALGIEFVPESGQRLSVTGGRIDYIRCNYDTRQSNATYQWILSFNHYVQDTNDTDARQALPARWQKRVAPHTYKKMPLKRCLAPALRAAAAFSCRKRGYFAPKIYPVISAVLS